jgi:hypothetical protein
MKNFISINYIVNNFNCFNDLNNYFIYNLLINKINIYFYNNLLN